MHGHEQEESMNTERVLDRGSGRGVRCSPHERLQEPDLGRRSLGSRPKASQSRLTNPVGTIGQRASRWSCRHEVERPIARQNKEGRTSRSSRMSSWSNRSGGVKIDGGPLPSQSPIRQSIAVSAITA
jgi:hypothetical protein